eukprot:TRINITY_DN44720_c0_g1_i1.p1 TRINITY_DN44720_c0_g1~~TRINITY_DN44720_c0_g1_i1.p1  ORF type:complete len:113 (+),score=19.47 TRINITY_DN44720_c0_g1_i1:113-451(+)
MDEERKIVSAYYDAMTAHDPAGMAAACCDDIEVTFPDSSRNWSSVATASQKFSGMFEALPNFAAQWDFDENESSPGRSVVLANFTADNYDQRRKMVYTLRDGKIARIDHVDV